MKFEYASLEWLWDAGSLRVNLPNGKEDTSAGSYPEVVKILTKLGSEGWEVVASAAQANWIYWTLKRQIA